ncbi:MAG: hypothetical protein EZS28_053330, partial [Streblomastix strix]
KKLSNGGFANTYSATSLFDGKYFCLKVMKTSRKNIKDFKENLADIERENQFLQHFDIPFIVKCHKSFIHKKKLVLVLDLCELGDLYDLIDNAVDEKKNIFLTKDFSVKLGDFGLSKDVTKSHGKAHRQMGTPSYFSPEMCAKK